jgi:hypothetical protein
MKNVKVKNYSGQTQPTCRQRLISNFEMKTEHRMNRDEIKKSTLE